MAKIESGNNYNAVGPVVHGNDAALGKYQILASNVRPWSQEILGQPMTPQQFLASPQAQDMIASGKLQQYYDKTGNHADAVAMWHSGQPYTGNTRADRNMTTKHYTNLVGSVYNKMWSS